MEQQLRAFMPAPRGTRKVILATTVAETGVTVDGIGFVVDCGFTKVMAREHHSGLDYLVVTAVSQASAKQRAGRAGRVRRGKCFRLYTSDHFDQLLPKQMVPEVYRTDLASTLLYLKALGVENLLNFEFVTPPPTAAVERALETLYALGAIDINGKLVSPLGHEMSELPLPPHFARLLLVASEKSFSCSAEALVICAMASIDTPWQTPTGRKTERQLGIARAGLGSAEGDFVLLYNVFQQWKFYASEDPDWTRRHMLNHQRLLRAAEIRIQLEKQLLRMKRPVLSCEDEVVPVCRAVAAALFLNACQRQRDGNYKLCRKEGTDDQEVPALRIHPSSILAASNPPWIVFADAVCTGKDHLMKSVSAIDPRWLPEVAPQIFAAADRYKSER